MADASPHFAWNELVLAPVPTRGFAIAMAAVVGGLHAIEGVLRPQMNAISAMGRLPIPAIPGRAEGTAARHGRGRAALAPAPENHAIRHRHEYEALDPSVVWHTTPIDLEVLEAVVRRELAPIDAPPTRLESHA